MGVVAGYAKPRASARVFGSVPVGTVVPERTPSAIVKVKKRVCLELGKAANNRKM